MNLLLCTDVIVDFLGRRKPDYDSAERLIALGFFGDAKLWAPAQSFEAAFDELSPHADAARIAASFSKLLEVVNPVDLTSADVAAATRMDWDDFGDCLVALSASKAGADFLVTRETGRFERSLVPPISPAGLLEHVGLEADTHDEAIAPDAEKPKKKKKKNKGSKHDKR